MAAPGRLTGLPPVIARDCRILVLGSFPSVASLMARRYYAHPQNRFWPIVGACIGVDLIALDYRARLARVKAHGIGIWDAIASCERSGSLDSAIINATFNDFASLRRRAPEIRRVCFNGRTSAKAQAVLQDLGYETLVLPSTSPANASQSMASKLARWREALA
ncbi:MAG: DNA-deoxyinosine glycosylase [Burkholderiales bacterium]